METLKDKNPGDVGGWTPLHEAALGGHFEICRHIIETIEHKNPADEWGRTPLHEAAEVGY